MQELFQLGIEAVAEADGVGDSLNAVCRAGQEMRSLLPSRQRIARQVIGLRRLCIGDCLRRIDAQCDQRIVSAGYHAGLGERIEQIGTHDAAQVRAVEINQGQDRRLAAEQIAQRRTAAGLVAKHGVER